MIVIKIIVGVAMFLAVAIGTSNFDNHWKFVAYFAVAGILLAVFDSI